LGHKEGIGYRRQQAAGGFQLLVLFIGRRPRQHHGLLQNGLRFNGFLLIGNIKNQDRHRNESGQYQ
jgi:hypothetical protein